MADKSEFSREQRSSCEVSTNAKGYASIAVKVYDDDVDAAADKAVQVHNKVRAQFPPQG